MAERNGGREWARDHESSGGGGFYADLGVDSNASDKEIKKAFRAIARECHPDVAKGDRKKEERFKRASAAFDILKDPEQRKWYDQGGERALKENKQAQRERKTQEGVEKERAFTRWANAWFRPSGFDSAAEEFTALLRAGEDPESAKQKMHAVLNKRLSDVTEQFSPSDVKHWRELLNDLLTRTQERFEMHRGRRGHDEAHRKTEKGAREAHVEQQEKIVRYATWHRDWIRKENPRGVYQGALRRLQEGMSFDDVWTWAYGELKKKQNEDESFRRTFPWHESDLTSLLNRVKKEYEELSEEKKRAEFTAWHSAWLQNNNPNGLYQEALRRLQQGNSLDDIERWADEEIERRGKQGGIAEGSRSFYQANAKAKITAAKRTYDAGEGERKARAAFKKWFDDWTDPSNGRGLQDEVIRHMLKGGSAEQIERLAEEILERKIREGSIPPSEQNGYRLIMLRTLRAGFAGYEAAMKVRREEEGRRRKEARREEMDQWVWSIGEWAYNEMKQEGGAKEDLQARIEQEIKETMQVEEGQEEWIQKAREKVEEMHRNVKGEEEKAKGVKRKEKRAESAGAEKETKRKEFEEFFYPYFASLPGRCLAWLDKGYTKEKIEQAALATVNRELEKMPENERSGYREQVKETIEKIADMDAWIKGLLMTAGKWFTESRSAEMMEKAANQSFAVLIGQMPLAAREGLTQRKDVMLQKILHACEEARQAGGDVNDFFRKYAEKK